MSVMALNIPPIFEAHFAVPGIRAVINTLNTRLVGHATCLHGPDSHIDRRSSASAVFTGRLFGRVGWMPRCWRSS